MSDNIRLTTTADTSQLEALTRRARELKAALDDINRSNPNQSGWAQALSNNLTEIQAKIEAIKSARLDSSGVRSLTQQYTDLSREIQQVQRQQRELSASTFDAFSRAQVSGQAEELRRTENTLRGIRTLVSSTVEPKINFQSVIEGAVGTAQAITSASAAARAFTGAISLGAAAFIDDQQRQVRMAEEAAAAKKKFDEETSRNLKTGAKEASAALAVYTVEQERAAQSAQNFASKIASVVGIASSADAKIKFNAETLKNLRAGANEASVGLTTYYTAQERAAKGAQDFSSKIATAVGAATAVKFDPKAGIFRAVGEEADKAGKSILENSRVIQHASGIVDSALRGSRGQMLSSIGAMTRDTGLLKAAVESLSSPWAAVGVAGVAVLGSIAYAAEQAYQRMASVRETQTALSLQGFGAGSQQQADIATQFDRNRAATSEYTGTQRELEQELNKLPAAAQSDRQAFEDLAKSLSGLERVDPAKAIEQFVKAAEHSPEALARLVEQFFNLRGVVDSSGMTLSEHVAVVGGLEEKYRIVSEAIRSARGPLLDTGKESRQAQNAYEGFGAAVAIATMAEGGNVQAILDMSSGLEKARNPLKEVTVAADQFSSTIRDQNEAIKEANRSLDDRVRLLNQLAVVRGYGSAGEYGVGQPSEASRGRQATAEANVEAEARKKALSPGQEEEHRRNLERINAEAQARRADLEAQRAAAQQRLEEAERVARIRLPGGDVTQDVDVQKAQAEVQEAQRRIQDQSVKSQINGLREVVAEEQRGSAERIAAQEQIIAIDRQEVAAGRESVQTLEADQIRLATLKRQLATRSFQESRDNARAEVELAKGNVDQIIAAYDRLRQSAQATNQTPAIFAQINREEIRDLESAQQKAFQAVQEYNSSVEKLDTSRIAAEKARLGELVAAHQISKAEMFSAEARFTAQVMAEEEKRVQEELKTVGLTEAERQKLYEHLADLYTKDAERAIQAQEKITQAVEAENAKREKSFTNMFDKVGDGIENLLVAGITRSKTRTQAFQEFGRSIATSLLHEIGTQASNFAGEKLGPMLGLTPEQSKGGLGSVLGTSLFKALGLEKDAPKDATKDAADKLSKAADAQQSAVKLQQNAGDTLLKAGQALLQFAQKMGTGGGGAFSDYGASGEYGVGQGSGRDPRGLIPYIRERAVAHGIDPDVAVRVAASEGLSNPIGDKGKSFGAFQLYTGGGEGNRFQQQTGLDPSDPANEKATIDFALARASQVGWGPWHGAARVGIGEFQGIGTRNSMAGSTGEYGVGQLKTSMDGLGSKIQSQTSVTQQGISIDQTANSVSQQLNSDINSDKQTTDQQKQAVQQNTQAVQQLTQKQGSGGSGSTSTGADNASKNSTSTLQLFTQGVGIASSAAALFGNHLSTTARAILGAVGVISQLSSFAKNLGSVFDLTSSTAKTASAATSLLQTANTGNTIATTLNTTATYTNSAAQSASSAGSFLKAIPLIGGLFEQGGIVPSAAGGMLTDGGTLAILHPREMVLPAHLSTGLQNMINTGRTNVNSGGVSNFNYSPNITGYHPFESKSSFENLLRQHGSTFTSWVENGIRNGALA